MWKGTSTINKKLTQKTAQSGLLSSRMVVLSVATEESRHAQGVSEGPPPSEPQGTLRACSHVTGCSNASNCIYKLLFPSLGVIPRTGVTGSSGNYY